MRTVSAKEAKARFGQLIDIARREPVTIEKHGRPVAVIISIEDYEELAPPKGSNIDKKSTLTNE